LQFRKKKATFSGGRPSLGGEEIYIVKIMPH